MNNTFVLAGRFRPAVLFVALLLLPLSGCGLGLDTEGRIERAEAALAEGEYRAAIIDAKNVLLDEPENVTARVLLGRASVAIGDGASGEKELRRAIELGADKALIIVDFGRALLLQGEFDTILEEVDPALAANEPDRLAMMRIRGDALLGLQRTEDARDLFTEVLDSDANDVEAYLGIVRTYLADGNLLQAREVLQNGLQLNDSHVPSWLTSGLLALRSGDLEMAARDFSRAAELAKQTGDAALEMSAMTGQAEAELARDKLDAVRIIYDRMLSLGAQDTRTILLSARIAVVEKDWSRAQEALQEVLRRVPEHRQAQMLLGYVHKESGNLGQAEMYLSAVVNAEPNLADARRLLAETRFMLNKAEDARATLDPLLAGQSPDVAALSMAAAASLSLNEFEDATEILERSVEAEPDNVLLKIQLAFAYYRSGESARAQSILEAIPATSIEGNEFQRDSLLVLSMMAQGDRDAALQLARDLQGRLPDRPEANTLAGALELSMGENKAARKSFEAANRLNPDDVQSLRYLAQLDVIESDTEAAKESYERILELRPTDIAAMVALAELSARSEDLATAREWLQKARESDSAAVVPRQILGSILLLVREFEAAEEVIVEALEINPDEARLHELMGLAKLNQRFFRDAEFSFGRALELQPDNPSHRYNLARSQLARGNKASAITTLQDVREQTLSHLRSAGLLATLLADTGDVNAAVELVDELKRRNPDNALVFALQAEIEVLSGDLVKAARSFDRVLDMELNQRVAVRAYQVRNEAGIDNPVEPLERYLESRPLDTNMRVYLAQAHQTRGEAVDANAQYERVLADDPDNFVAANNLAWSYFEQGDSRAEEAARRAYEIEPNSGAVADTLGWILVEKGSLEEGIDILQRAYELSEGRPEIRYHLAAALAKDGQVGSARNMLQELLESGLEFPSREAAEKLLSSL